MKLAYVNELPQKDQLAEFIQIYTNECIKFGIQTTSLHIQSPQCVISVYDDNVLVGIGCMDDVMHVHVRPAYRHRQIETTVHKLLQAEFKSLHALAK
ncbi:GNAT family N-acetyltransferase [Paenibacillus sp. SYP-B3998]|uniref:GNAT family N-acetyltransferase n=1 Tax=Paenibacillus sp. SYP-B3998 TaxID=2678564 RepID=A0A6G4A1K4_9BACL|nr:GNAT family N-acetyltransferase [Paenibacillus sp. SYP-B3998]NEW08178.1 GNAT family N-acetyltransferase [Paenibacillus sp. SYP-B3998]